MEFADYLSRHPNSLPTGENMNENHVINTLPTVQYTLHTAHRKSTNHRTQKTDRLLIHIEIINKNNFRHTHLINLIKIQKLTYKKVL